MFRFKLDLLSIKYRGLEVVDNCVYFYGAVFTESFGVFEEGESTDSLELDILTGTLNCHGTGWTKSQPVGIVPRAVPSLP